MKKKLLFLIPIGVLLLCCNVSQGQSFRAMFLNPNVYRTYVDLKVKRIMNIQSKEVYSDSYTLVVSRHTPEGVNQQDKNMNVLDYKILSEDDNGNVIIRILPCVKFNGGNIEYDDDCTPGDDPSDYYFAIPKSSLLPLSKVLLSNKIVGNALVMPVKFRPSKEETGFSMTGEFTAGYAFGFRRKISKGPYGQTFLNFIPVMVGISAGKYFVRNSDATYSAKTDSWALSYSMGLMMTINRVNIGGFYGWDYMVGSQRNWFYQGEGWYSLGLGYKLKAD